MADVLAVLIIGAPGAGKTTVLWELSGLLESERIAHGVFETEQLSFGWPTVAAAAWIAQLRELLALQRRDGRRLFLLSATPERQADLDGLVRAAGGAERVLVVCLHVTAQLAAARVAEREPEDWSGRTCLVAHARELAEAVPGLSGIGLVLDTEALEPATVAARIARELRACLSQGEGGRGPVP